MTLKKYAYHLVNVFAQSHFEGNPLAVFASADGLTDEQMQKIATQFNLSETVFIFNPTDKNAVANLRIFTPDFEMPLAGHPILGSAFVLYQLKNLDNRFILNTPAKSVHISVNNRHIELGLTGFTQKISLASQDALKNLTQLKTSKIDDKAFWVNSGSAQLLLKVFDTQSLYQAMIDKDILQTICQKDQSEQSLCCLWCEEGDNVFVRFFFMQNGVLLQDSGTGSACANLGAYFISQNRYPIAKTIYQGDDMGRPSRLTLSVDKNQQIFVGGQVIEVGRGEFYVP